MGTSSSPRIPLFRAMMLLLVVSGVLFWSTARQHQQRPVRIPAPGHKHGVVNFRITSHGKPPAPTTSLRVSSAPHVEAHVAGGGTNSTSDAAAIGGSQSLVGSCGGKQYRLQGKPVDPTKRSEAFRERQITDQLLGQLSKYATKVHKKLTGVNKRLWKPYLDSLPLKPSDVFKCVSRTPECALFTRTDVQGAIQDAIAKEQEGKEIPSAITLPTGSDGHPIRMEQFMLQKCCVEHHELYTALSHVRSKLNAAGVPFWLTAGSLLGAVREEGTLITWDTDVDVLIDPENEEKVQKMMTTSKDGSTGFSMATKTYLKDQDHGRLLGVVYGTLSFRHEEASRVEIWVRQQKKKMQRQELTFPLRTCYLYDLALQCPAKTLDVLVHGYGDHWCTPCKHKSSNCKSVFDPSAKQQAV